MIHKPEIQYIGQFYVYGSEARQLEQKKQRKPKTKLPLVRVRKVEKISVDPVALGGIVVAVALLVVMAVGSLQLYRDWTDYNQMSTYVSHLKKENAQLTRTYRAGYDLEEVRKRSAALGLVPESEAQTMIIAITAPAEQPESTFWEEVTGFLKGLFA